MSPPMNSVPTPRSTDHEAVRLFRRAAEIAERRWRAFVVVFATVAIAVQAFAFVWPGTYEATAAVELLRRRFSAPLAADREATPTLITSDVSEAQVNSQIALMTSEEVLREAVVETGLDRAQPRWYMRILFAPLRAYDALYYWFHGIEAPSAIDRAVRSVRSDLTVEPMKDSNVLAMSYTSGHPDLASGVLQQILTRYIARQLESGRSSDTEVFFDRQSERLAKELAQHEDSLLQIELGVGGATPEAETQVRLALDAELRTERAALARRAAELDETIAAYRAELAKPDTREESSTTVARNDAALQLLQDQVVKLELEQVRLLENYQPTFPLVIENQRKLEVARAALHSGERGGFANRTRSTSSAWLEIEMQLDKAIAEQAGIQGRTQVLEQQLRASQSRLAELGRARLDAKRLERLVGITADKYALYLKSGEAARIDAALDGDAFSNIAVVQKAVASARPVKPKKLLTLLIALLGGVLAGLGTCAWLELRETGFETVFGSVVPGPAGAS
jgi:polysaccharide biosynthesis protein PslE